MKDKFPFDAVAIWPMKGSIGNENAPFQLECIGEIQFEKQSCDLASEKALLSDGDVAVIDNGCFSLNTYRARKFRPKDNELTLFISAEWVLGDSGTLFFSDFLTLSIYSHGLACAFVGVETNDGRIYREVPLGFPTLGGKQFWILRISEGTLTFLANGTEYCRIPFSYNICSPFDSDMIFGGFQSLKPDTYDDSSIRCKFRRLYLDTVALWHRGLSDFEISELFGLSRPLQISHNDERFSVCEAYNYMFDASVKKDFQETDKTWKQMQETAVKDSTRPTYHLTQPFGHIFDPCGAFYYDNKYHVFSYRSLYSTLDYASLNHYVSDDLVHWTAYPIGPLADSEHDVFCIYLMNHFIDKDWHVRILYTGQGFEGKCGILAESSDRLISYTQKQAVLKKYHHDGHVFIHNGRYYTVTSKLCRGTREGDFGDPVMMWSSDNLVNWIEEGEIFCQRKETHNPEGFMEFPYLLSFGARDVLILGGHPVKYYIGHFDWETLKFSPVHNDGKLLDFANPFHCFNPLCVDNKGENGSERRLIMALYNDIHGNSPVFWEGVHAQPRILSLHGDLLHQEPLPELSMLRTDEYSISQLSVSAGKQISIDKPSDSIEIEACFAPTDIGRFGISLGLSEEESLPTYIYFDAETRNFGVKGNVINIGEGASGLSQEQPVNIRIFLDKQFLEVFVNGQTCTTGIKFFTPNLLGKISVFAEKSDILCNSLRIWKMSSSAITK